MKLLKTLLRWLLGLLLALALLLAVNTLGRRSRQIEVAPLPQLAVDEHAAAEHLAAAIRHQTISAEGEARRDQFMALHAQLQRDYPRLHALLRREQVGASSLLYSWPGSDAAAKPVLWLAHQDVVPVAPGTESQWQQPPFAGVVRDGYIWGRGAWDNKSNLISQMEALELLAASGFKPRRTLYLAFGADEELGGLQGAAVIAKLLQSRGVKLESVLDEGLVITEGIVPGLKPPAALIGIAEKGYLSVELKALSTPGHSSMPPTPGSSAIGMMAQALQQLDQHQLPAGLRGIAREMFETLAPEMDGFQRVALSNLWLFGPVVQRQLEAKASSNALLRTTTALTIVKAGNKDNVLPGEAEATVNFRLLPGDSIAAVLGHVRQALPDANRFTLSTVPGSSEPSPVSPSDAPAYQQLARGIREVFPGTLVAPGLMTAATDSRHFAALSEHIYRFSPVRAGPDDLARFHGTNERIASRNLVEMIRFYHRLATLSTQ
ncbi:M20 family peptidase [Paucibacter sp. APW11]|uniref:M20 family peptidase n=1 Tax=Roseateles aquae TaxID=3077235 RepID=A0ABU3P7Q3_9BURK|nr:M20 family peptidase [Paucibacter sp. APW11]MDT8998601.1 M20 family peptidase [Paucibacter sp. APW11]